MQLVYLSPVPWTSFAQRPHRFVEWFHEATAGNVVWIDPYPTRLPSWRDIKRPRDSSPPVSATPPAWLTVVRPHALPIEPLPGSGMLHRLLWQPIFRLVRNGLSSGPPLLGIGKPSELAWQLLLSGSFPTSFYDAMDDFPAFYQGLSRFSMTQRERRIGQRVSKLLVSSTALSMRWSHRREVILARNACAVGGLPACHVSARPDHPPVLGYVGTMGAWFDWSLVYAIARARPALEVQLIGPVFHRPPSDMPPNITLLPACEHGAALAAMQRFSAGLIPFSVNRLTESVDPIKYYEYRALGLPVLSSSFGEMRFRSAEPGVFFLHDRSDIGTTIDQALACSTSQDAIHAFREHNSWKARFAHTGLIS